MSLVIENLGKRRHGVFVLDGVNLEIGKEAICGLLGRNGAGKSTLLNIIADRFVADGGDISLDGERVANNGKSQGRIILMDETWPYPVGWRLRSVFRLVARRYGGFDDVLAGRMMESFGLSPDSRFVRLSSGQRGAARLIVALCASVDVVLLDEPLAGLDAKARDLCRRFIAESYGERPRTMIVSTHLIGELEGLFEHAVILDHGRVLESFDTEELRQRARLVEGPVEPVREYLSENGLQALSETRLGDLLTVGVRGVPTVPVPDGVTVRPVDLNDYFIHVIGASEGSGV